MCLEAPALKSARLDNVQLRLSFLLSFSLFVQRPKFGSCTTRERLNLARMSANLASKTKFPWPKRPKQASLWDTKSIFVSRSSAPFAGSVCLLGRFRSRTKAPPPPTNIYRAGGLASFRPGPRRSELGIGNVGKLFSLGIIRGET